MVFQDYAEIDLGNKRVECWYFGPGNGPGDVVVYVPEEKVAWTSNFIMNSRATPMHLGPGPEPYVETLQKVRQTLDIETIVPGHGPMGDGNEAVDSLIAYLQNLEKNVKQSVESGHTIEETLEAVPLPDDYRIPATYA